jgi:Domain of unknown function (DUF3883)
MQRLFGECREVMITMSNLETVLDEYQYEYDAKHFIKVSNIVLDEYQYNSAAKCFIKVSGSIHNRQEETKGGGYGDPGTNKQVEDAAIRKVSDDYKTNGWKVEDRQPDKCGFDLCCTKNKQEEHVEVKGISGDLISFLITYGEVKRSRNDDKFILIVVTAALTNPKLHRYTGKEFNEKFKLGGKLYRADLRES